MVQKDDRKFEILYAIIRDYITNAEPIGSRTIEKRHSLGISSATIRNEMSDLEDMGYLIQPHASSGRVPTEKAYRLYVDKFMKVSGLDEKTAGRVRDQYEEYVGELEASIRKTAEILSKLTSYTALVSTPSVYTASLREVRLLPIERERVFLFIVTVHGMVKNAEIRLSFTPSPAELERAGNFLSTLGQDKDGTALLLDAGARVTELGNAERLIVSQVVPAISALLRTDMQTRVHTDGITEILNYPEFQNVSRARQFMETMHRQDLLAEMLMNAMSQEDLSVRIGSENDLDELSDCSILTATYKLNGRPVGTVGLVGPTRMDYDKCVSALSALTNELSKRLDQSIGGAGNDG